MFDKVLSNISDMGLSVIRRITDLWAGAKADSLIDYTQVARVEPIVLIDADCLYLEALPEVQQSLLSIFAGYYLQAVAISTTVGKVEVTRHLDKLNPRRNPGDSAANTMGWLLAQESYTHTLPMYSPQAAMEAMSMEADEVTQRETFNQRQQHHDDDVAIARAKTVHDRGALTTQEGTLRLKRAEGRLGRATDERNRRQDKFDDAMKFQKQYEADEKKFGHQKAMDNLKYELAKQGFELQKQEFEAKQSASEIGFGKDTITTMRELTNLSVGKMFMVEITDGFHRASIPIAVRLMASSIPTANLVKILTMANHDNSVKERYHAWRSGRLEFIKDLCFCQDIIDTHRKNLMLDSDGVYTNLLKRSRNNQLSAIVSGNPSVATSSNLVIISDSTAREIESTALGKLSNFKIRERIFAATYIMIMVVIDKQWDRATFYHRGINMPTEVSLRDLKASNKGSGPDVSDILKAYQLGNSPSL